MAEYYFITDKKYSTKGVVSDVKVALDCGVKFIQYRPKFMKMREMLAESEQLRQVCESYDATLIINDRVDLAYALDAEGIHLGQDDMPTETARGILGEHRFYGVSISSIAEFERSNYDYIDYFGAGAIYPTGTKDDAGEATGLKLLTNIRRMSDRKLAAIGGITLERIGPVINAGADYICAISEAYLYEENNLAAGIKRIVNHIKELS